MASNATNVSARRAKAIALIQSGVIHSQSDLVAALKKNGYRVTQATASRDLEEIGAVRGRGRDGESMYQIRESSDDALTRRGKSLVTSTTSFPSDIKFLAIARILESLVPSRRNP